MPEEVKTDANTEPAPAAKAVDTAKAGPDGTTDKPKMGKVCRSSSEGTQPDLQHNPIYNCPQLMQLLNKISPKMARKCTEQGAKKAGVGHTQAAAAGKAVETVVEKQQAASVDGPKH